MEGMELEGESVQVVFLNSTDGNQFNISNCGYCLVCGSIAVLYFDGKVMKREAHMCWDGQSFQDLFDCFLQVLGVKKNVDKGKTCEWNFDKEPLPLCVDCEKDFHFIGQACRRVEHLRNKIKTKMVNGEDNYVRNDIYNKQDDRFFEFRKQALGENFRGHLAEPNNSGRNQRPLLCNSTSTPDATATKEEGDGSIMAGAVLNEPVASTSASISKEPTASTSAAAFKEPVVASIFTFSQELGGSTSGPSSEHEPKVSPSNLLTMEPPTAKDNSSLCETKEEVKPPIELEPIEENNVTTSTTLRRSLRIRNKEVKYREDSPSPDDDDDDDALSDTEVSAEKCKPDSTLKAVEIENNKTASFGDNISKIGTNNKVFRGQKRKCPPDDFMSSTNKPSFTRRRYTSTNMKIDADLSNNHHELNDMDANEKYLMASAFKDPLFENYYYRNLQFIWIKEERAFQCSSCSLFIRGKTEYELKGKFHKHYIVGHSDRFKCRLCPAWNLFQSDLALHNHFRIYHRGFYHFEPQLDCRSRARRVSAPPSTASSSFMVSGPKRSVKTKPILCAICSKPNDPRDKKELEEHQLSHMNAEEKATYLKNLESIETFKKRKTIDQCTTSLSKKSVVGSSMCKNKASAKILRHAVTSKRLMGRRQCQNKSVVPPILPAKQEQPLTQQTETCKSEPGTSEETSKFLSSKKCDIRHEQADDMKPKISDDLMNQNVQGEHVEQAITEQNQISCTLCGKVFRTNERLDIHKKLHHVETTLTCHICQHVFKFNFMLRDHLVNAHGVEPKTHTCLDFECGATFLSKSALQSHYRRIHHLVVGKANEGLEFTAMDEPIDVEMDVESTPRVSQEDQNNEITVIEDLVTKDIEYSLSTVEMFEDHEESFDYSQLLQ